MRGVAGWAAGSVAVGAALIAAAVALGQATVALVVVIPVIYGRSPLFAGGVGLILVGLVGAMLTGVGEGTGEPRSQGSAADGSHGVRSGGLVLVGPVPIVWGSASSISRRTRWLLAAAGGLLLAVALAVVLTAR